MCVCVIEKRERKREIRERERERERLEREWLEREKIKRERESQKNFLHRHIEKTKSVYLSIGVNLNVFAFSIISLCSITVDNLLIFFMSPPVLFCPIIFTPKIGIQIIIIITIIVW